MSLVKLDEIYLSSMANAIRSKTGSQSLMTPRQMIKAVAEITPSGETPIIIQDRERHVIYAYEVKVDQEHTEVFTSLNTYVPVHFANAYVEGT